MAIKRSDMKNRRKLEQIELEDGNETVEIHEVKAYLTNLVILLQREAGKMNPDYLIDGGSPYNGRASGIQFALDAINNTFGTSFENDPKTLLDSFGRELKKYEPE
jgi:hypothetical protein